MSESAPSYIYCYQLLAQGHFSFFSFFSRWALGLLLHELLSPAGQTPFVVMNPRQYSDTTYVDVDTSISAQLASIVRGLLRADVSARLTAGDALLEFAANEQREKDEVSSLYRIDVLADLHLSYH